VQRGGQLIVLMVVMRGVVPGGDTALAFAPLHALVGIEATDAR
jgi:hypothetical protein